MSGTQNVTSGVWTKIAHDVKNYDTANCYNTTTYRFTPNVAGYYLANTEIIGIASTGTQFLSAVYKNGSFAQYIGNLRYGTGAGEGGVSGCCIVYMNGSTDYIESYGQIVGTTPYWFGNNSAPYGVFTAVLVRSA